MSMGPLLAVAAVAVLAALAAASSVLAWHIHRGRHPTPPASSPYRQHSADPRGRWRVTRHDPHLLPEGELLHTDPDHSRSS